MYDFQKVGVWVQVPIWRCIKDGAYFCYCAHLLRIAQGIDRTRSARLGNFLAQNDEFNFAIKRATKMQENFGSNEIQLMDVLNQEQ